MFRGKGKGSRTSTPVALAAAVTSAGLLSAGTLFAPGPAAGSSIPLFPDRAGGSSSATTTEDSGIGTGLFAFRSGGKWFTGQKVLSLRNGARSVRGVLSTDDPAGRRIAVSGAILSGGMLSPVSVRYRVSVVGDGPDVQTVRFGQFADRDERLMGFGQRSDHVDQRGNVVENYVGEGPFQQSEYDLMSISIPPWSLRRRSDATYFPMPWLLSTDNYGVLVENNEVSRFNLDSKERGWWTVNVEADQLSLRYFVGNTPADVVRNLTAAIGRQPEPAAPWIFGPWFQTGHQNTQPAELDFVDRLRSADAPVSAVETHMRYMPCGSDVGSEAAEAARAAALQAEGLAAITYTREAICAEYTGPFNDAVANGAFLKRENGEPYLFDAFVGSGITQVGMFDFSDPDALRIYRSILDRAYDAGYDGWMEDYGEYAPFDALTTAGPDGPPLHNYYPVMYHRAGKAYADSKARPVVSFVRSGWTGSARHSQIVWGGDPSVTWGFDGLTSSVTQALTMGLSGVSLWGSDIGGFFSLSEDRLDTELLARWIQFGAFSGVMRSKGEGIGKQPLALRPQVFDQPTLPLWRRYAKLRTQLYPYLVAADSTYQRRGMPIMRHLVLTNPWDRRATGQEDQYMFGPDLLVAPVLKPGQTTRSVYLPPGRWINFGRAVAYGEEAGSFDLGSARVVKGKRELEVPAPLERIPVMVKAGALLPMLPADTETLSPYAADDFVGLDDNRSELHVIAFPRGSSDATFYRSGNMTSDESRDRWRLTIDGGMPEGRPFSLDLDASMKTLERPFVPRTVKVNGRPAKSWSYDRETGVLSVSATLKPGSAIVASR
jgi:alpha-glucosidase (family GH31 glycosyl hydrolase)